MTSHVAHLRRMIARRIGVERDEGQGLVEYSLLLLLIALVCIGAVTGFGTALAEYYQRIVENLP